MSVNVEGQIKGIAASVAGKCSCVTHMTDALSSLFPDEGRKSHFINILNQTYNLTLDVTLLIGFNTLQDFTNYINSLLS